MMTPNEQIAVVRQLVESLRAGLPLTPELEAASDALIMDFEPTPAQLAEAVALIRNEIALEVGQRVDTHFAGTSGAEDTQCPVAGSITHGGDSE